MASRTICTLHRLTDAVPMPLFQSRWGFTGLTWATEALTGLLSYTISILLISSLSSENFRKIQKTFLVEIVSQQRKTPRRFFTHPLPAGLPPEQEVEQIAALRFRLGRLAVFQSLHLSCELYRVYASHSHRVTQIIQDPKLAILIAPHQNKYSSNFFTILSSSRHAVPVQFVVFLGGCRALPFPLCVVGGLLIPLYRQP